MFFKTVLVFCAQAVFIQVISAQYLGAPCAGARGVPIAAAEWDCAPAASLSASNGPGVAVSTASPLLPAGVSVLSENAYEGTLAVDGTLPFLGTVALEGTVPSAGAGAVAYRCGNGVVGITVEDTTALGVAGIGGPLGCGVRGAIGPIGPAGAPLAAATLGAGTWSTIDTWGAPCTAAEYTYIPAASLTASNGPGLAVSSASSIVPAGVSVQSENIYEGDLTVGGALPFLGTVAVEGALPTAGAGAVSYGCGNGAVGIKAENIGATGFNNIGAARSGWGCRAI